MTSPSITPTDVQLLETILAGGGWMLAREIATHWRWLDANPIRPEQSRAAYLEASKRAIRAIASASHGAILSAPGTAGYKLRSLATAEEVTEAVARLRHQANDNLKRATELETFGRADAQLQLV